MKQVEKVINILINIIFYLALIALAFFIFGVRYYNVLSESMEPSIPKGSLIVVWPTDFHDLEPNDVITARFETGVLLTHRAVEINEESRTIITKGDNNPTRDAHPIEANQVVGKVVFHVPILGDLIAFLRTPAGISIIAGLIISYLITKRFVIKPNVKQDEKVIN